VVAAVVALGVGGSAELAGPEDDGVVEKAAWVEVDEESGDGLVGGAGVAFVPVLEVAVPIPDVSGGDLDESDVALANLGSIAQTRGDLDGAEKLHRESLEINRKLRRLEGQAANLANLGVIAEMRGKIPEARELWTQSRDLYAKVGMPQMVKQLQGWLDGLPPG
jgi:tetratricopeptide (TPR) repeat protein